MPLRVRHVLLLAQLLAGTLRSQTATIVPCALDNTLYESSTGSFSNGLGDGLFAGVTGQGKLRRALMKFDVAAALPPGALVLAATLQVEVTASVASQDTFGTLHLLGQAFGEGTSLAITGGGGQGAPATVGDSTWLHAVLPLQPWSQPGGDFAAAPFASLLLPVQGPTSGSIDNAVVQSWLDAPAGNRGFLLKTAELPTDRTRRLASREHPTSPPTLTVHWLAPGQVGQWGLGCPFGAGHVTSSFVGAPLGGTTIQLAHSGTPAFGLGANFFSLALDPIGALVAPSCRIHLPLSLIVPGDVFLADAAGTATSPYPLPIGFAGYLIASQAAVLDGSSFGLALGNASLLVLQ